jgi:hypothetical protein
MYLKLEDEHFYWHRCIIVDNVRCSNDCFVSKSCDFLSNKNKIIYRGEQELKNILKENFEYAAIHSKEKEIKKLLKQLKQPIEIEVKE